MSLRSLNCLTCLNIYEEQDCPSRQSCSSLVFLMLRRSHSPFRSAQNTNKINFQILGNPIFDRYKYRRFNYSQDEYLANEVIPSLKIAEMASVQSVLAVRGQILGED